MAIVYRKSLRGIDEVAFKSGGLPLRLVSYLLAVDGESEVEVLAQRHPHLPSLEVVLHGLMEQGFLEVAGVSEKAQGNVVEMASMRVGNGAYAAPRPPEKTYAAPARAPEPVPAQPQILELDRIKTQMVRDITTLLGSDSAMVITKIQACRNRDELFATMLGVKKILTMYLDNSVAEKFAVRYQQLSS